MLTHKYRICQAIFRTILGQEIKVAGPAGRFRPRPFQFGIRDVVDSARYVLSSVQGGVPAGVYTVRGLRRGIGGELCGGCPPSVGEENGDGRRVRGAAVAREG